MFPQFNIYSTPLLILVIQGLIFSFLLFKRYYEKRNLSDLLLALILLITCYHRTSYTIGFMGWYDTFRTTKINYWLIPFTLTFGPLIYFYVKSVTSKFRFRRLDLIHFLPWAVFFLIRIFIFVYDAAQPDFDKTQNGLLKTQFEFVYLDPIITVIETLQITLYLAFAIQQYLLFKNQLRGYFSNAYDLELKWIRNFLYIYTFLFIFNLFQSTIDAFILELNWTQNWWYHLLSAVAVIYVGIKGYFTDTSNLQEIEFEVQTRKAGISAYRDPDDLDENKGKLKKLMETEKPWLNPNLNLSELANLTGMTTSGLSELINSGFNQNFNDYINTFRIEEFKERVNEGQHLHHSLVGIAYDCGFNSKATFNRVFKKLTGISPSQYLESQN